ncbi:Alpha-copaene synthase [Arachis hypogaea]|nr:Alpha-copaene synthase [Arachis hypogaea]
MRARSYMSFYEEDPLHDKVLLNFAKLNFDMLQKWYQKEIGITTKWWRNSEFGTKVPYAREGIVELYFWPFAINSELKYTTFRVVTTKVNQWMTIVDDTYDAYGTIQELKLLTLAIQRWDISYIASLPECFKTIFNAIVEVTDEIIELSARNGETNLVLQCVKQADTKCLQQHLLLSENLQQKKLFIGFLITFLSSYKLRHLLPDSNDLASHKFEQQRKHVASSVECCMKQYSFSKEEAHAFIKKDINNYWKDMNEEYLKLSEYIPRPVLDCIVNMARICEFLYANSEDKVTNCALFKDHIVALLLDPVVM